MARLNRVDVEFTEADDVAVHVDSDGDDSYLTIVDRWGNLSVSIHQDHFKVIADALAKEEAHV